MLDEWLAWNYTLDDLDHMARNAVGANRTMAAPWQDRYDAAYFAIIEALLTAELWPQRYTLIAAGVKAISEIVRLEQKAQGIDRQNMERYHAGETHNGFAMYWTQHLSCPSPEDPIIDRLAADQILATLTPSQRRIVAARAAAGDNGMAAEMLGKPRHSVVTQLNQARRRFLALWHEGETPHLWAADRPAPTQGSGTTTQRAMAYVRRSNKGEGTSRASRPRATHCKRGHQFTDLTTYWRADGSRTCRTCFNRKRRKGEASC